MTNVSNSEKKIGEHMLHLKEEPNLDELETRALAMLANDPNSFEAWDVIGGIAVSRQNYDEAEMAYRCLNAITPNNPLTLSNLAKVSFWQKKHCEAAKFIASALKIDPTARDFYQTFNVIFREDPLSIPDCVVESVTSMLSDSVGRADSDPGLSIELFELWRSRGVEQAVQPAGLVALAKNPHDLEIRINFALALREYGQLAWSTKLFAEIVEQWPKDFRGWLGFGACVNQFGNISLAREAYEKALTLNPEDFSAIRNLAFAVGQSGDWSGSLELVNRALEIKKNDVGLRTYRHYLERWNCDWTGTESDDLYNEIKGYCGRDVSPFHVLGIADAPDLQMEVAARWVVHSENIQSKPISSTSNRKIRIGWFSNDFYDHATMHLLAGVFRCYDKERFEFYIYDYTEPSRKRDGDNYVYLCHSSATMYRDIYAQDDKSVVTMARQDVLDIAIDLKGFTHGARNGIFAAEVAPIQVAFLGFPGTLGKPYYHYAVVDDVVAPEEFRKYFTESLIIMPDCYQPNDNQRFISQEKCSREAQGLPENAFVFACFNQTYKFSSREFSIWMRLLHEIEDSVLWLYVNQEAVRETLRNEAVSRGIDPDRVIFASTESNSFHLARLSLADLFLDCFFINAHTTASDALWSGVPIVTRQGKQFAARVASSLLSTSGLGELIVKTDEQYFDLAKRFASDEEFRSRIRSDVEQARSTSPLFDSDRYTENLLALLEVAAKRSRSGCTPRDLTLADS
jgi:protein O-GlcNAc transferase